MSYKFKMSYAESALFFSSIILALVILEVFLRVMGIVPESKELKNLNGNRPKIEELKLSKKYTGFPDGTFRATPGELIDDVLVGIDGFRDWPIPNDNSERIMLLGDSFTWGASASKGNSFARLLSANGFQVFNTGIPGIGPKQYRVVAEKYLQRVRPNRTLLFLYLGNDFGQPEPMIPNHPRFWSTNAGWLWAYDDQGKPVTMEESYRFIFVDDESILRKLKSNSSLLTALKYSYSGVKKRFNSTEERGETLGLNSFPYNEIETIRSATKSIGSELTIFVIPEMGEGCGDNEKKKALEKRVLEHPLLRDAHMLTLNDQHYTPTPDCHLNDSGHKAVFQEVLREIRH